MPSIFVHACTVFESIVVQRVMYTHKCGTAPQSQRLAQREPSTLGPHSFIHSDFIFCVAHVLVCIAGSAFPEATIVEARQDHLPSHAHDGAHDAHDAHSQPLD